MQTIQNPWVILQTVSSAKFRTLLSTPNFQERLLALLQHKRRNFELLLFKMEYISQRTRSVIEKLVQNDVRGIAIATFCLATTRSTELMIHQSNGPCTTGGEGGGGTAARADERRTVSVWLRQPAMVRTALVFAKFNSVDSPRSE